MTSLLFPLPDRARRIGEAHGLLLKAAAEQGNDAVPSPILSGRLYLSRSGWLMLSVPNALVRGVFDTLDEEGLELPPGKDGKPYQAHVSVMRPEEVESIGGADRITERGKTFHYQLGPLKTVNPLTWDEMSRVWFIEVKSTELQNLRKSYGLSGLPQKGDKELPFHCTIAVRRKNVLRENEVAKAAATGSYYLDAAATTPLRLQNGFTATLLGHLRAIKDRGDRSISEAYGTRQLAQAFDTRPGARQYHFLRLLRGQEPPVVTHPLDRVVQNGFFKLSGALDMLAQAKDLSDMKQYQRKHELLRGHMKKKPAEWLIDSKGRMYGVTHRPTGWRFHMPPAQIPSELLAVR